MSYNWKTKQLKEKFQLGEANGYQEMKSQAYILYRNGWISEIEYEILAQDFDLMIDLSWVVVSCEECYGKLFEDIPKTYFDKTKDKFIKNYFTEQQVVEIFED